MKTLVFPLTPKEMDELENNPGKYYFDEDLD